MFLLSLLLFSVHFYVSLYTHINMSVTSEWKTFILNKDLLLYTHFVNALNVLFLHQSYKTKLSEELYQATDILIHHHVNV